MSFLNLLLIVIIVLLVGYCARLKLRQEPPKKEMSMHEGFSLQVSSNDIMQYLRDTANDFMPLMESKGIDFCIKCSPESMMGWIDTDIIDKIILLLLSDMARNAEPEGKVTMEAFTNKNYDNITISINDNSTKMLKFSIVVVQQLVHLHQGSIKSDYYEGQGNIVIIELPIKRSAFKTISTEQGQPLQPAAFHIPNNIELNIPTIELPDDYDTGKQSLGALVQQAYNSSEQKFLQRATNCVKEHIDDSDYDRDSFAADMGASASTLYNKLRAATGMNVTAFIRAIRIQTAIKLAKENPDWRVSDIAYRVGFKDPKYFATTFKKVTGTQPKEYFEEVRERLAAGGHRQADEGQ